jgi:hypothetical protein
MEIVVLIVCKNFDCLKTIFFFPVQIFPIERQTASHDGSKSLRVEDLEVVAPGGLYLPCRHAATGGIVGVVVVGGGVVGGVVEEVVDDGLNPPPAASFTALASRRFLLSN